MPNLDSGRYFLSILLPIKNDEWNDKAGMYLSPVQSVRDTLSVWATAQQSPATCPNSDNKKESANKAHNSPFAKNLQTHFTRIFVINNAVYNGRNNANTISTLIKNLVKRPFGIKQSNMIEPQQFDQLTTPYLAYIAEIDAPKGDEAELDQYLEALWDQMQTKFERLFENCYGFEKVADAPSFCQFMRAGKVDTIMPFNDYWQSAPPLKSIFQTPYIIPPVLIFLAGLYAALAMSSWWLGLAAAIAGLLTLGIMIMVYGAKPFPMAPDSDLRSVLKALYLQQNMIDFTIANQGADAEVLHKNFCTRISAGSCLNTSRAMSPQKPFRQAQFTLEEALQ